MTERGAVYAEEHYKHSKMLDHSSWLKGERILPRKITGSDIDCPQLTYFDNWGAQLIMEFVRCSEPKQWHDIKWGQRWGYQSLIRNSRHVGVVCCHDISHETGRMIDTRYDVTAFQVMAVEGAMVSASGVFEGNDRWQEFVFGWFLTLDAPEQIRRTLVSGAIKNDRRYQAIGT